MVGGGKRSRSSSLMGNHQKCWLWGRHALLELLRADQWHPLEIGVARDFPETELNEIRRWAERRRCPVEMWSDDELEQRCRAPDHQGLIARMPEFPYRDPQAVIASLPQNGWCVLLDGIQDPFNFGAILRSAEVLGAAAAFVGTAGQSPVNSQVVRSSAGAVLHLPLARAATLGEVARSLQARGMRLYGASEKGTLAPRECDLNGSVGLVIGNEGRGISAEMLGLCNLLLTIPQAGRVGSLNAAVAAGILCYEVARQRCG